MTWLEILGVVLLVAVLAALFGIKPKGTRKVANTQLMTAARVVLAIVIVVLGLAYFF